MSSFTWNPWRIIEVSNTSGVTHYARLNIEPEKIRFLVAVEVPNEKLCAQNSGAILDTSISNVPVSIVLQREYILQELQARPDWKGRCVWGVFENKPTILNITAISESARMRNDVQISVLGGRLLQIFLPFQDSNFLECCFVYGLPTRSSVLFSNYVFEKIQQLNAPSRTSRMPTLKISGPETISVGQTEMLHISHQVLGEPTGRPVDVYLETQGGYLPKTKLELPNGEGEFKISALGLDPGDKIKIKAGFFFYTSVTEYFLSVQ